MCVLELCRRIRKSFRDGRLMSASHARGSPGVPTGVPSTQLLPFLGTHLLQDDMLYMVWQDVICVCGLW